MSVKAERETHIRWDEETKVAHLWTANRSVAELWRKRGYDVQEKWGSWWAEVPKGLISFRRLLTDDEKKQRLERRRASNSGRGNIDKAIAARWGDRTKDKEPAV